MDSILIKALDKHIRVNLDTHTVEIYDDYGVKLVLRDLDETTFNQFKLNFTNF